MIKEGTPNRDQAQHELNKMVAQQAASAATPTATSSEQNPQKRSEPPVPQETPAQKIEREKLIRYLRSQGNRNLPALPATVTAAFTNFDLEKAIEEMQQLSKDSEMQIRILDSVAEQKINFYQDLKALETNEPNYQRKMDNKSLILFADSIGLKYFLDNFPVFRRIFITNIDELKRNGLVLQYILPKTQKRYLREQVEKESKSPPKVDSNIISSLGDIIEKNEALRQLYKILLQVNKILDIKTRVLNEGFVKRRELIKTHASILFNYLCFEVFQLSRLLDIHNSFIKGRLFANQNITGLRRMDSSRQVEVTSGSYQADGVRAKLVFRYNTVVSQTSTDSNNYDRLPYFRISLEPMIKDFQTEYISLRYDSDFTKGQTRNPVLSIDLTGFRDDVGNYPLYRNPYYQEYILTPTENLCLATSGIELGGRHHFVLSGTHGSSDFNIQIIGMLRSMFNGET